MNIRQQHALTKLQWDIQSCEEDIKREIGNTQRYLADMLHALDEGDRINGSITGGTFFMSTARELDALVTKRQRLYDEHSKWESLLQDQVV